MLRISACVAALMMTGIVSAAPISWLDSAVNTEYGNTVEMRHYLHQHGELGNQEYETQKYIKAFADAGCDIITIHKEATRHLNRALTMIRDEGKEVGLAINPSTSVLEIENELMNVDYVMVMSVNPGFGGQAFIPQSLKKIKLLDDMRRAEGYEFRIMVDGGVGLKNHIALKESGADILITGEAFFRSSDKASFIEEMES